MRIYWRNFDMVLEPESKEECGHMSFAYRLLKERWKADFFPELANPGDEERLEVAKKFMENIKWERNPETAGEFAASQ